MKQNKFLTGLIIVTVLGAGAFGFLLFQAKSKYNEALESYSAKASELTTLQAGKPFPDEANYKKMLELQKSHQGAINALQRELAAAEIPLKPLTPVEFQDKLKATLDRIREAAAKQNVALAKEKPFNLGFDKYLTEPPKEEAAAPLGRMLEAMEKATLELIKTSPAEIRNVNRIPLAEEGLPGQRTAAATPAPARGGSGSRNTQSAAPEKPLVQRYPFEIQFVAQEPKVRVFLNAMVSNKEQFYIPAAISILNQQPSGPAKTAPGLEVPPPVPVPDPNANPDGQADPAAADPSISAAAATPAAVTKFIVGEERLDVLARFEYVDFADPPSDEDETKGGKKATQPAK